MNETIARAIAMALGHEPPFLAEELSTVSQLRVEHARGLEGIDQLPALQILELIGCDVLSAAPLASLQSLIILNVRASILGGDSSFFSALTSLFKVKLRVTDVSDLTPLRDMPTLRDVEVVASPLDDTSYRDVVAELRTAGVNVVVSTELERDLTLALWEAGMRAGYYEDFGQQLLCAPGLSVTDTPEFGQPAIPHDQLRRHLEAGTSLEELYRLYAPTYTPPEPMPVFDPLRLRERGTADDARRWLVGASLPDELYRPLMRFVDDFPTLDYLRETEELHAEVETRDSVTLPTWLKQVRSVLAAPFHASGVCHLELPEFPGIDFELSGEFGVYEIRGPADDAERRQTIELSRIYPVVSGGSGGLVVLALRLDEPQNDALYFYHLSDLSERADGIDAYGALQHYVDLFDLATAVTLQDGTRIERRRGRGGVSSGNPTDDGPLAAARRAVADAAAAEGAAAPAEPTPGVQGARSDETDGPGMKLLAALTGLPTDELATADGFARGMSGLAGRLGAIAGDRVSRDEGARADAQGQFRALAALLRQHGMSVPRADTIDSSARPESNDFRPESGPAGDPGDKLRARVNGVLTGLVARLEALRDDVLPPDDAGPGGRSSQ